MKKITLTAILISSFFINNSFSQSDNDAFAAALIGAALVASAVEEHKESLEQLATDIIISEYSDINEFRLKVIGLGGGGEAWSSDGKLSFVPLGLTIMKDGQLTEDKKLIVLLLSRGWVNEYGLDYTKITSELWEKEDWNNFICKYSKLNSPSSLKIVNNLVPVYNDLGSPFSRKSDIPYKTNQIIVSSEKYDANKSKTKSKNEKKMRHRIFELYVDSFMDVGMLNVKGDGLHLKKSAISSKIVYPFYNLSGDDYIVDDYSQTMKIFANESRIGLYQKTTRSSMLLNNFLVNKVHDFINSREKENLDVQKIIDNTTKRFGKRK